MSSYFADNDNFKNLSIHVLYIWHGYIVVLILYVKYIIECLCVCMSFHDSIECVPTNCVVISKVATFIIYSDIVMYP